MGKTKGKGAMNKERYYKRPGPQCKGQRAAASNGWVKRKKWLEIAGSKPYPARALWLTNVIADKKLKTALRENVTPGQVPYAPVLNSWSARKGIDTNPDGNCQMHALVYQLGHPLEGTPDTKYNSSIRQDNRVGYTHQAT